MVEPVHDLTPPDVAPVDESELARAQRNFSELLQELRVAQAGVQILFAFLLTLAFSGGMSAATSFQRAVYAVALVAAAASAALLTAPVAHHRILFRLGCKPHLVRASHRMAMAGLALLLVSMVASVLLAAGAVLPRVVAVAVAVPVAGWFVALWAVVPLRQRGALLTSSAGPPAEPWGLPAAGRPDER
jgi:hypothetical protein